MLFDTRVPRRVAMAAALCLGLTPCMGAPAAQSPWHVLVWSEPVVVSIDTDSITRRAALTTVRVLWDYAIARPTRGQPSVAYKSMIGLLVFDCATARFGGAGSVSYSGDGGGGLAVARSTISPDAASLSATEPGTLGRDLTDLVCARSRKAG